MKRIQLASAIALVMGLAVSASSFAAANGGTITFNGSVTDATCTIKGGAGTDGGTNNFIVALDAVPATALTASGQVAAPKPFTVVIGGPGQGTCEDGKVATMSFETSSPRIDAGTGNLTNALADEAKNVQVQLLDNANKAINLAQEGNGYQATIANNTATLNYSAQYFATGASTPGLVSTSVVYAVAYN